MKILLAGVNAKYVHTNLAIRILRAFLEQRCVPVHSGAVTVQIAEWNVNEPVSSIVRGVLESGAEAVFFSTYIWNRRAVFDAADALRAVQPELIIGLGGPEAASVPETTLGDCPAADLVITGEGELTLSETLERLWAVRSHTAEGRLLALTGVPGLVIRERATRCLSRAVPRSPIEDLDLVPFPYAGGFDFDPENRIVYYETSRGCPFSCAYCLSAVERGVRWYPLGRVLGEVEWFLERRIPLVKLTDRTFNLDGPRSRAVWERIRDRWNGVTCFHFEISAALLDDADFAVLETLPAGAVQFEIGIQSTNPATLAAVSRTGDFVSLAQRIRRIPRTIHTHVDLIAGLPHEGLESLALSVNRVFALGADMLQLGFLKVLPGAPMAAIAAADPAWRVTPAPPYEVLATPDLSWEELLAVKDVEQVLDSWYNSGLMRETLSFLAWRSPFCLPGLPAAWEVFRGLAGWIRRWYPDGQLYLPRRMQDSFACLAAWITSDEDGAPAGPGTRAALERLRLDYLLQAKPGAFPCWYERRYDKTAHQRALDVCAVAAQSATPAADGGFEPAASDSAGSSRAPSRRVLYAASEWDSFDFSVGPLPLVLSRGDFPEASAARMSGGLLVRYGPRGVPARVSWSD